MSDLMIKEMERLQAASLTQREINHMDEMIEYVDTIVSSAMKLEGDEKINFLVRNILVLREHFVVKKNTSRVLTGVINALLKSDAPPAQPLPEDDQE